MQIKKQKKTATIQFYKLYYNTEQQSLCLGTQTHQIQNQWPNFGQKSQPKQLYLQQNNQIYVHNSSYTECCSISDDGMSRLSNISFPQLRCLKLGLNQISATGVLELQQNKLPELQQLDISHSAIQDQGFIAILQEFTHRLSTLVVMNCLISWIGISNLIVNCPTNLKILNLNENEIGVKGVKFLIKSNLLKLQSLYITSCKIGDEGAKYLIKSYWPCLKKLAITQNNLKIPTNYQMMQQNPWNGLQELNVGQEYFIGCFGYLLRKNIDMKLKYQYFAVNNKQVISDTIQFIYLQANLIGK